MCLRREDEGTRERRVETKSQSSKRIYKTDKLNKLNIRNKKKKPLLKFLSTYGEREVFVREEDA
jgi:hypothetical protein